MQRARRWRALDSRTKKQFVSLIYEDIMIYTMVYYDTLEAFITPAQISSQPFKKSRLLLPFFSAKIVFGNCLESWSEKVWIFDQSMGRNNYIK